MVTSHLAFSQFVHLRPNQEVPELVELVFNDGTTKRGNVKNNKMDRILLRILSQDPSAFRHASIEVDYIRFKPEGETEFQRIPTNEIKHVLILEDEVKRYDRINVYRINKRKLKIKDKEPALMIQTPTIDDALVVYTNFYFNYGNGGGSVHDKYNVFIRKKESDTTYYFNFIPAVPDRQNLKQLKILAKDNQEFCYFIDQMCDRKSDLYNSYYDSQTEYLNEIRAYIKENRKQFKYKEDHIAIVDARFKYLFTYILEKFKEYTAT